MRSIDKIFSVIALLAIINHFVTGYLFGDFGFNIGRFVLAIGGGWYVVSRGEHSLWFAASIGPFILFIDHLFLGGGHFLLEFLFSTDSDDGSLFEAFLGVLLSFLMFFPVAAILSLIPGVSAMLFKRLKQEA